MASHSANCIYFAGNPGDNLPARLTVNPDTSSGNGMTMLVGDTLTFTNAGASDGNVTISYGESGRFTANKTMSQSLSPGETIVFTATSADSNTWLRVTPPSGSAKSLYISIVNNLDDSPSSWTFPDKSKYRPGSYVYADKQISGINTSITISCSGSGSPRVKRRESTSWVTSISGVQQGDYIQFRLASPPDYNQTYNATITGGSASDTWTVSTGAAPDPNTGAKIPSGITGDVALSDLGDFFGRRASNDTRLYDYRRGLGYVPNITENNGISTSQPALTQFRNAYTSIYFKLPPEDYMESANTVSSAQSLTASWQYPYDYIMGFSDKIANELEFKVDTDISGGAQAGDASIHYNIPNPGAWSKANQDFNVRVDCNSYSEAHYIGTVTLHARHPAYPSSVVSWTMDVRFFFFGP